MNNKLLLSDETKVRLNEGILSNMQKSAKNADMIYSWIKKIELLEQKLKGHNAKHPSENHTEEKFSLPLLFQSAPPAQIPLSAHQFRHLSPGKYLFRILSQNCSRIFPAPA